MRKCFVILLTALFLCGCAAEETMETIGDDHAQSVMQEQKNVLLSVDEDAEVVQGERGTLYLCDGYEVTMEVLPAGNLSGTVQDLTGFAADDLTVLQTAAGDAARYECIWTAAGETGDVVGRAVILDDGVYHYCVTAMAEAEDAQKLQKTWKALFESISITPTA